ncbi:hypothetical protein VC33_09295 [Pseudomonas fluorescens]|nr:hypothetical protein VC33_09295 [Pseudomonas fluorescens]
MDLLVSSVRLTGEVDVGPRPGIGKSGNMSLGVMKKLGSAHGQRALRAGMPKEGARLKKCSDWTIAIAGKPAPTGPVPYQIFATDTHFCGSGLARDKVRRTFRQYQSRPYS